jgi:hypothetical protein
VTKRNQASESEPPCQATSPLNNVITIDDERIKSHLERVVRDTVEETLNALLDAEADRLCNAQRYEPCATRRDSRAGHYERGLQNKAGEVRLRVPKLRRQTLRDGDHRALSAARELGRRPNEGEHPYVYLEASCSSEVGRGPQRLAAGCDRRARARLSGDSRHL